MWQHIRQGMAIRRKQKAKQKTTSTNNEKEEEKQQEKTKKNKKKSRKRNTIKTRKKTRKKHETIKIHNPGLWLVKNLINIHTRTHTQLITTQLTHTYSSTHNLLHTNPSPSLFSFLLSPCHLYLSFAACWKKLTCGVTRSFNGLHPPHVSHAYHILLMQPICFAARLMPAVSWSRGLYINIYI